MWCALSSWVRSRSLQRGYTVQRSGASQLPHHLLPEAVDLAFAGERDEAHLARLARLEAHGRAGRNVEAAAARRDAVELQGAVGLGKVVVRADLDRPVACVRHGDRHGLAASIDLDVAGRGED